MQRIVYTEGFGFPRSSRLAAGDVFNVERRAARTLRAEALLDGSRIDTSALLRGRVAIVGGSHAAGRDLHNTPIGVLPGAVIQANTVIHAQPQLRAAEAAEGSQRVAVALLFALLALLSLPMAAGIAAVTAVLLLWLGASYETFTTVELALLLFVQFKFMTWLVEPFWKPLRADGWQMVLPKYLRKKKDN
jgi:CHASE2 domain-containing sensor protein